MARSEALAALLCVLVACGRDAAPAPRVEATSPSSASSPTSAPVVLHEWGLVATVLGREGLALAGGPGRFATPSGEAPSRLGEGGGSFGSISSMGGGRGTGRGLGKPVIYARLLEGAEEARFVVTLGAPGTRFVERFPEGELDAGAGTLRFEVVARRAACAPGYPARDDPRCAETPDGFCELAELSLYDVPASSCLDVGGVTTRLLFYRAEAAGTLPLELELAGASIGVTGRSGVALPRALWLVERSEALADTRVRVIDAPPPGKTRHIGREVDEGAIGGVEAATRLRAMLTEAGLNEDEARAFLDAWQRDLLGAAVDDARPTIVQTGRPPEVLAPAGRAVVYLLPEREVERLAPMRVEPRPAAVRRVFLVRVAIDP